MFTKGSIYFISNYQYEDGGTPTNKLLLVVCIDDENSLLLRALPTSQQKVPDQMVHHGCTNNNTFSFFTFLKDRVIGITNNGDDFSFDKNTFVFFRDNVEVIPYQTILSYYPDNASLLGELSEDEYKRFMKCIKGSKMLRKKHKEFLAANLQD